MLETLRQKQTRFSGMAARLILRAQQAGYDVTLGEAWQPLARDSLHGLRLAIDLNLFREGGVIVKPLHEWWEGQHEDCRWGGRTVSSCPNREGHYCIAYEGRE